MKPNDYLMESREWLVALLSRSVEEWNRFREEHPQAIIDLGCTQFRGLNLCGANLSRVILRSADLRETNLTNVNFRDASLCGANLCRADAQYADFTDASLIGATFAGTNFTGSILSGVKMRRAQFSSLCALLEASLIITNDDESY